MNITGSNFIGFRQSKNGTNKFQAVNPFTNQILEPQFADADESEINQAIELAHKAFLIYRNVTNKQKSLFLNKIAENLESQRTEIVEYCNIETALGKPRLDGELTRTINQLKMFTKLVEENTWREVRIDKGNPERKPAPKPDIRRYLIPTGVVGVFGACNFPLAFSVAGGDTASALAAGCPVVYKAHYAHPGTSEIVANQIIKAAKETNMPEGVFSMLQGKSNFVGQSIVKHQFIKAVGFTGSFKGGKALFDLAMQRPEPIPVFAEMGSTNPVFIFKNALKERRNEIANGLIASVTLGVGQFCTNPGLVIVEKSEFQQEFIEILSQIVKKANAGVMLTKEVKQNFDIKLNQLIEIPEIKIIGKGETPENECSACSTLLTISAKKFVKQKRLEEEVFGPSSLIVTCEEDEDLQIIAESLKGHLTMSFHGLDDDIEQIKKISKILEDKAGRLIFNGFPTGVEVCHAMHHGGPFPATTDSRYTSVGTAAIKRFTKPVAFQDYPNELLPQELCD